jgi:hypothetical protein
LKGNPLHLSHTCFKAQVEISKLAQGAKQAAASTENRAPASNRKAQVEKSWPKGQSQLQLQQEKRAAAPTEKHE